MADSKRLEWVDTAKGISILLVVMMYVTYSVGEDTGNIGFMHYVIGFANPFRMPEFFTIAGLFLARVIDRPFARYADRRVVHYLYFYLLWVTIHILVKAGIGQGDPTLAATQLAWAIVQPYGVLWFIYVLGVFGLAVWVIRRTGAPPLLVFAGAALLEMAPIDVPSYTVTQFAAFFVFFYFGYIVSPHIFRLIAWVQSHPRLAIGGLAGWGFLNYALVFSAGYELKPVGMIMGVQGIPGAHLLLGMAGALAVCATAALIAKLAWMDWLRWLGEHSLIVYLAFALPMSALRILLLRTGILTDPGWLSLVILIVSTIVPIALYLATQKTGIGKFLFERPHWAHLPGALRPVAAAPRPSATPAE